MTDIILINPAYSKIVYKNTKVKVGVPVNPLLSLALLAASATKAGYKVKILDLDLDNNSDLLLENEINKEKPKIAGITFTTPLYTEAKRLAEIIKQLSPDTLIIAGGAHATFSPESVIDDTLFDIAAIGEADFVIKDVLELPLDEVKGIVFRRGGSIVRGEDSIRIQDLDLLPYPAWHLYDLSKYDRPSLSNNQSPPGYLETSRGCPGGCVFCGRHIQGNKFRPKSVKRVVSEIEYMLKLGFKEINIVDDNFSTDLNRAKLICEGIIKRGLKFAWYPTSGTRVDTLDRELLSLMKRSGCYKVALGIESGNQNVLKGINKGIKLDQVERAVKWAKMEGLETFGFFMLGLPGDTEETMQDTINFAKKLKLDLVKFSIMIPFPGTKIFKDWKEGGYIKTYDWEKYNLNVPRNEIYNHPTLDSDSLNKYFKKAYFSFYFDPLFLYRRFKGAIKNKTLKRDIILFFKTNWFI